MSKAFRTHEIRVTSEHFYALQTFAKLHGLDCVEEAAACWLNDRLMQEKDLSALQAKIKRAIEKVRTEYFAEKDAQRKHYD